MEENKLSTISNLFEEKKLEVFGMEKREIIIFVL